MIDWPHYELVPKPLDENKAWRRELLKRAATSPKIRQEEVRRCREDLLYYVNAYCVTYDPRLPKNKIVPFVTYEFQDRTFTIIHEANPDHDLLIEKSRDMGASWMLLTYFEWRWHFHPAETFLLVSRKEELVDKRGDPKSLFWKIDCLHKYLPNWLLPNLGRKKLHLGNLDNGSTIDGESTTGDVARGDRRTAIGLDEFASVDNGGAVLAATSRASNCRIFNSTPKGTGNAFYDLAHSGRVRKVTLHWSEHPDRSIGLYRDKYGKKRSPWYDQECRTKTSQVEIAQELDIDYMGSGSPFFDSQLIEDLLRMVRSPLITGEVESSSDNPNKVMWIKMGHGRMKLWLQLKAAKPPEDGQYVIGADVCAGKGATYGSNSVLSVVDRSTGIKVGEYVTPNTPPHDFAHIAVRVCRFFNDAKLIWEANGPGAIFGGEVLDTGYRNVHMRVKGEKKRYKQAIQTLTPGFWTNKDTKRVLLAEYANALRNRRFTNYSLEAVDELKYYEYQAGNRVEHARGKSTQDLSGAGENHGDRVIADALAYYVIKEVPQVVSAKPTRDYPLMSFGHRRQQRRRQEVDKELKLESY